MILQRLPIAKTMAIAQVIWGIILIGTGFAQNFPTMIALRLLLGILEAPIIPGNLLVLSMWYTRSEQSLRYGLMYTGLSVCFTGPIGYAYVLPYVAFALLACVNIISIGFIHGDSPEIWRIFFWITGGMTVVWSLVLGLFLPDNPVKAKFLSEREKVIAIDRVRVNQTGIENKKFKKAQFIEAMLDPKTWLMFFFNVWVNVPNGGLTNFSPLIIKGLGYTSQRSTLLTMPCGIMQTVSSYLCNGSVFLAAKYLPKLQLRGCIIIFGELVGMIASTFLYTLPLNNLHGRLGAMYVSYFYLGPYIISLSLVGANVSGHTKKVTVNAMIFLAYCISNIIGPQFFKSDQAPLYPLGIGAILGSYVLSLTTIILYMMTCWFDNKRRDARDAAAGERLHADTDFQDLTDKENIHFRYLW
ncbi:MAG: hypothetical protein M1834_006905 [Cirrosporium novae-zelandiae]|nr:MAG: hypothetical protein M1834_006905 [Cirrosporium novae-zelandiae]